VIRVFTDTAPLAPDMRPVPRRRWYPAPLRLNALRLLRSKRIRTPRRPRLAQAKEGPQHPWTRPYSGPSSPADASGGAQFGPLSVEAHESPASEADTPLSVCSPVGGVWFQL